MSLWTADESSSDADPGIWDFPIVTIGLLLLLLAIFDVETTLPGEIAGGELPVSTLISAGGLSRELVSKGEVFRLATCVFLHAGASHLLFNCIALFLAGKLETIIGRTWFLFAFLASGIGGSLVSIALSGPNTVSVGASGAILGLLVIQIIVAYGRFEKKDPLRETLVRRGAVIVIPTLAQFSDAGVDVGGHIGGSITGLVIGFLLLLVWDSRLSRAWCSLAWGGIVGTGALVLWGFCALLTAG